MATRRFYSRVPRWFLAMGVIASSFNAAFLGVEWMRRPGTFEASELLLRFAAGGQLLVAILFSVALWRRTRSPVLEINDERIFYSRLFRFFMPRKRIALSEIAEMLPGSRNAVELRMDSGEVKKLPLAEVRQKERDAVRRALEQALSEKSSPSG